MASRGKSVSIRPGDRLLDVGCGNGGYVRAAAARGAFTVGCDLSLGMLRAAANDRVACADAVRLPFPGAAFDVALAAHMLYHVEDRATAARELRRVLAPGGTCIAVTNGAGHLASLRELVEGVVGTSTPGWRMSGWSTGVFSLENGAAQMGAAFPDVRCARPASPGRVIVHDPVVVAGYVASLADHYQGEVSCPWAEVVEQVRLEVGHLIERDGAFITSGDVGVLICR